MSSRHTIVETVLGPLVLTAADDTLTGVYYPHHWHPPDSDRLGAEVALEDDELLTEAAAQLRAYLAGERDDFTLPTHSGGDAFEESVWTILKTIPYGETTTYGAIATRLGDRTLAQRVGQAVGHNPLSIIIPCHRVVGAGGKLTGYAGGLRRKRFLLDLELPATENVLF